MNVNRKQRRAAKKDDRFLIGVQISDQVRAMFDENQAGQLGADMMKAVMQHALPKIMEQNGGTIPDDSYYLFRLDPIINGSKIHLALELDWANKIAALAFSHELPDPSVLDHIMTEELPYEKAPRLSGENLEHAGELYRQEREQQR
jgi:hypothetical protein